MGLLSLCVEIIYPLLDDGGLRGLVGVALGAATVLATGSTCRPSSNLRDCVVSVGEVGSARFLV
jgi:hypothetical protein